MRLKVLYRKNLKMSPGKLAAQVAHVAMAHGCDDPDLDIAVLGVTDRKYESILGSKSEVTRFRDKGLTEVGEGEETCAAFYELEPERT